MPVTTPQADDDGLAATDGRRARAERSRDAVVEAILELLYEGNNQPGAADIAERAGVSLRSVFRHFDDLESLHAAAVERHQEIIAPLFELAIPRDASGDLASPERRIEVLAKHRAALYEEMVLVRVVAERLRDRSASIRAGLERSNRILKAQVLDTFAPELDAWDKTERRAAGDALDLAASYAAWRQCREDQGLSVSRASAAVSLALTSILTSGADR